MRTVPSDPVRATMLPVGPTMSVVVGVSDVRVRLPGGVGALAHRMAIEQ
jgi:hypothetical protein